MQDIAIIDDVFIDANTDFKALISLLRNEFSKSKIEVPMRHHHDFDNPKEGIDSTLLIMPAWNPAKDLGVKIVTVSPQNSKFDLPSIQGTYIYFDAHKGLLKAILSAKSLTAKRTAATSALATSFLAKENAESLLMIGTGALSANLILAHSSVRPLKTVYVWGRNYSKAEQICEKLKNQKFSIKPIDRIEDKIEEVDIISCATLSQNPLVRGRFLRPGQHIDLVGSYKKDTREADDDTIKKSNIYLDSYLGGLKESGDIVIPMSKGILNKGDIKADLFELCQLKKEGRKNDQEITVFKSVGHALEDLVAAGYYYEKFTGDTVMR